MNNPTALQLELNAQQTAERLRNGRSVAGNRLLFYRFFLPVLEDPHRDRWISYCRQFIGWLLPISEGLTTCCWNPGDLQNFIAIVHLFHEFFPEEARCAEAEHRLHLACALHFLYVGELQRAAKVLGLPAPAQDSLNPGEIFDRLLDAAPDRLREELRNALSTARADSGLFRADVLQVLLVADDENASGVILPLHVQARERPGDAEEDRVLLNNITPLQHGSLLWSLNDAVAAGRTCLPQEALDAHYSLQFSVMEKEAELVGASLGFAAALLSVTGAVNQYYRLPLYTLNQNAAFTGAIAPDGRLLPVDEGGLAAKLRTAFFSPIERVFIARQNLPAALRVVADLERRYPKRLLPVHGLEQLQQALDDRNLVRQKTLTPAARLLSQMRRLRHKGLKAVVLFLLMAAVFLAVWNPLHFGQDREPADYDVKGSLFIVKNKANQVLWDYDFGAVLTWKNYMDPEERIYYPRVLLDDLNSDGKNEVLIGFYETEADQLNGHIYCFAGDGQVKWIAKPGRKIRFGDSGYEDSYYITEMHVLKNRTGLRFLCAGGRHRPFFPSFVALYDSDGKLKGQYWNSGTISDFAVVDYDADGDDEIIAGGYRNIDGRAFLAVLEIDNMWGLSPQDTTTPYFSRDLPRGTERWYLRLPASPFSMKNPYRDYVENIARLNDCVTFDLCNHAMAEGEADRPPRHWGVATYSYDYQLHLKEWHIQDLHAVKIRRHLGREMTQAEIAALSRNDYWDGEKWVETPTESSRYKKVR